GAGGTAFCTSPPSSAEGFVDAETAWPSDAGSECEFVSFMGCVRWPGTPQAGETPSLVTLHLTPQFVPSRSMGRSYRPPTSRSWVSLALAAPRRTREAHWSGPRQVGSAPGSPP